MEAVSPSAEATGRFVRVVRPLPDGDPSTFLRWADGEARGFWGRGERWVAWAGAAAVLGGGPRGDVGRAGAPNRFGHVREEARDLLGGTVEGWRERAPRDRPRIFGGFSFLDQGPDDPVWTGFPRARFVLPRLALERRVDGFYLAGHGPAGEQGDLEGELDRLAQLLIARSGAGQGNGAGAAGPDRVELNGGDVPGDRERWNLAVGRILAAVHDGRVEKAVLARTRDVAPSWATDTVAALAWLRRENARAHVFLFEPEPGKILLGAAPEILAEYRDGRFEATAVAGSIGRGSDPEEDRALAAALLASAKDRIEHRLTVEEITEVLSGRLSALDVDPKPRVLTLARIQHLETRIRGRGSESEDVLSLVEALHPTPAVCGRPKARALELIRESEPFDRGWYAGPVGWFDPAGDGDFVPALRSAVGDGRRWRLFAGAGIVEGSDPALEWAETALKFEPALRALRAGAPGAGRDGDGAGVLE